MVSSRQEHHSNSSSSSCSVRKWVERGFLVLLGFMIAFCVSYTKTIGMMIRETSKLDEQLDAARRASFAAKTKERQQKARQEIEERFLRMNHNNGQSESEYVSSKVKFQQHLQQAATSDTPKKQAVPTDTPKVKEPQKTPEKPKEKANDTANAKQTAKANGNPHPETREAIPEKDKLNIVLFYADDWTMRVLGKLDPTVKTPNIDKMADNGMLFLKNCVTTSVCWISRATLVTGTYYSRHLQAQPFEDNLFKTHNWNETLFPRLKQSGYYTGMFGKWHAPGPHDEMQVAFDQRRFYYGKHWTSDFAGFGNNTLEHVTDVNRKHAIQFLRDRPKDKKFALKVSFFATHAEDEEYPSYKPMNWSRRELYPDDRANPNFQEIVPPKTATEQHWKDLPAFLCSDVNAGRLRWRRRWEPHEWQKNIRDLFAMATEVDWAIGEIIKVLKEQGVYNETLLVFTTDNGDLHGEHGLAEKWFPMEESIKVPLVIQDPRMPDKHRGSTNSEWTLNVDLAPTLLGAAGLDPSSFMQGRDIAELYLANTSLSELQDTPAARWHTNIRRYQTDQARKPWRTEWFYEWNMGDPQTAEGHAQDGFIDAAFALITHEWKYIYWPLKVYEQLFHRSVDLYDEYDILQNYYIHQETVKANPNQWIEQNYRLKMETFTPQNKTPLGDSIESTAEVYAAMKLKYEALKKYVQEGGKI